MKYYRHLFFDLDHTLWDFESNSRDTLRELYQHFGLAERLSLPFEEFLPHYQKINDELWSAYRKNKISKVDLREQRFPRSLAAFGLNDAALSREIEEAYVRNTPRKTALMPGCRELLEALHRQFHLHIITNGFRESQEVKLRHSELKDYFQLVLCSEDVGVNKPAARIFAEALQRSGAERRESLMIGDHLIADILGARRAGMDQAYYNPSGNAHKIKATHELRDLRDLQALLLG